MTSKPRACTSDGIVALITLANLVALPTLMKVGLVLHVLATTQYDSVHTPGLLAVKLELGSQVVYVD